MRDGEQQVNAEQTMIKIITIMQREMSPEQFLALKDDNHLSKGGDIGLKEPHIKLKLL